MNGKHFLQLIATLLVLWSGAVFGGTAEMPPGDADEPPAANHAAFEETWGIRVEGIRQSAAGYMLDFRYRVLNAEKAAPLFDRQTKPYLIDQTSGKKFQVPNPPKTGPLRSSNPPQDDRVYAIFFGNPGTYIRPGSKVTVVIGDFRVEDLLVR
jgi:hypothetical protein